MGNCMALAYLLLIATVLLSLKKKRGWMYVVFWFDFVLIVWIFLHHITVHLGLNL